MFSLGKFTLWAMLPQYLHSETVTSVTVSRNLPNWSIESIQAEHSSNGDDECKFEFGFWRDARKREGGRSEEGRPSRGRGVLRTNARSAKRASVECRSNAGKEEAMGKTNFSMGFIYHISDFTTFSLVIMLSLKGPFTIRISCWCEEGVSKKAVDSR